MRLLLTGAGGLLGGALAAALAEQTEVVAAVHRAPVPPGLPTIALDLLAQADLAPILDAAACDALVHAAALAHPDVCEREPERAVAVNVTATARLARACRARGLPLVALSTDLVFDSAAEPRAEDDPPRPQQVYGRSKLQGERAALDLHPAAAVLRVCLVAGRGHGPRGTASESVAWALRAGERPRLFVDQWRTPVDAHSLAALVVRVLAARASGIFHAAGPERVSRYELGLRVAAVCRLDAAHLDAVASSAAIPGCAPRPADVALRAPRARALGWAPLPLDDALAAGRPGPPDEPARGSTAPR